MIVNKQSIQLIEKSTEKTYFVVNSSSVHLFLLEQRMDQSSRHFHTKCTVICCQIKTNLWLGNNFFSSSIRHGKWLRGEQVFFDIAFLFNRETWKTFLTKTILWCVWRIFSTSIKIYNRSVLKFFLLISEFYTIVMN